MTFQLLKYSDDGNVFKDDYKLKKCLVKKSKRREEAPRKSKQKILLQIQHWGTALTISYLGSQLFTFV